MKKIFILILCFVLNVGIIKSATPTNTKSNEKLLSEVETYINSLKSISGAFNQTSSNGATDSGVFYISKPGKMRLEYKSPILLVADGTSIVYFDKKLDQISYLALESNPASIILMGNVKLTGINPTVKIAGINRVNDIIEINLITPNEKQSGRVKLLFQEKPLSLIGWQVRDPQGITTTIELSDIKPEPKLSDSLFKITRGKSFSNQKTKTKYY